MTPLDALDRMIRLTRDWVADNVPDLTIVESFQNTVVRCIADERNLAEPAGRHCLTTTVSLLARMGVQVQLDIPRVRFAELQPPLDGDILPDALVDLGADLVPGTAVTTDLARSDLDLVVGDTDWSSTAPGWRLSGGPWMAAITLSDAVRGRKWTGSWPVGPMVAAALAAAEVFKHVLRGLPLKDPYYQRHLMPTWNGQWDFGDVATPPSAALGSIGFISMGAINQAAMFTLLRVPHVSFNGLVLDDDDVGPTNLNRNQLNRRRDVGRSKVDVVAQWSTATVSIQAAHAKLTSDYARPLPSTLLVGVDDIPTRWVAQRGFAGWLGVSGTSHFEASSSSHLPGEACAGCLHPKDDPGIDLVPTVSFVSFWAGLSLAVRLLRHALGAPFPRASQHLWLTPLRTECPGNWSPVAARRDCPVRCSAGSALVEIR